ncbi:MAG: hypothetical protein AB1898_27305 [Acidobacteriota bacterium]
MMRTRITLFGTLLAAATTLWAAEFWEKKEYTEWSKNECEHLLEKSPWSLQYTETNFYAPATNISSGSETLTPGQQAAGLEPQSGERESRITFYFTLLTAKPVRMAEGRLALLRSPEMKEKVEAFISQPVGDEIIFRLLYGSQPPGNSMLHDIHNYFRRATINDFQSDTILTSSETKVPVHIIRYEPPDDKRAFALLVFPRRDAGGQPFFTGQEKNITLRGEFNIPIAQRGGPRKFSVFVKMEPKKMRFQGEFAL